LFLSSLDAKLIHEPPRTRALPLQQAVSTLLQTMRGGPRCRRLIVTRRVESSASCCAAISYSHVTGLCRSPMTDTAWRSGTGRFPAALRSSD
jgi:hypothetical protein